MVIKHVDFFEHITQLLSYCRYLTGINILPSQCLFLSCCRARCQSKLPQNLQCIKLD